MKFKDLLNEDNNVRIEIECTEAAAEKSLLPLLRYFKAQGSIGHTVDFKIDDKWFTFDGDGNHRIESIRFNGKEYKK